jgi:hypothetical protein
MIGERKLIIMTEALLATSVGHIGYFDGGNRFGR